ncbi:tRNA (guanosine(46)-N7)-methyltransferase TrmB [Candidatus Hamiltonella defensa]|uniref:tRNA (guanosine(46)-N7)-methyltransferase TrmB n=1 Tax=Candidatus Williamhamiltonella defendens TaxID=138072 RepID=UPI00158432E4|nr:tRNA (guanosine(46)-N7)-methyltransferase TrmB [Candidatus Hamiltonella defensa]
MLSILKETEALRPIRSFVRRQGRLTKAQKWALDQYWPQMGVDYQNSLIDTTQLFRRKAPLVLEIGFGMGDSLVTTATLNPEQDFLGVEVHIPGIGACLRSAHAAHVTNVRIICHDTVEVLKHMIADHSLEKVQLFFPDPWHKARHHKRRIVQRPFLELVKRKLKVGGWCHMATDWQPYAEHMLKVISTIDGYKNLSVSEDYVERPESRPLTKFETRGKKLGHGVWDLVFEKITKESLKKGE